MYLFDLQNRKENLISIKTDIILVIIRMNFFFSDLETYLLIEYDKQMIK